MSRYTIRRATLVDCSDIATIYLSAFQDEEIVSHLHRNLPLEIQQEYQKKRFQKGMVKAAYDGTQYFKAVNEKTGKIVAFAIWQFPQSPSFEQQAEMEDLQARLHEDPPTGYDVELNQAFYSTLHSAYNRFVNESSDYLLHMLAVVPSHQRKGIGSLLIQHGLRYADSANARTYVEAAPAGADLYKRLGWKEVEEVLLDLKPYGRNDVVSTKIMFREPRGG